MLQFWLPLPSSIHLAAGIDPAESTTVEQLEIKQGPCPIYSLGFIDAAKVRSSCYLILAFFPRCHVQTATSCRKFSVPPDNLPPDCSK